VSISTIAVVAVPTIAGNLPKAKGVAPGAPQIKGVDPKKVEGGQEAQPQQSFVRKYWYIILPAVLLMSIGSPPPEEGGRGGGGGKK